MSSDKKVILITGANTGLGYEIVKALYATSVPYELIIGSRTLSKADDAIKILQSEVASSPSTLSTLQIDVSSDTSLEAAVKTVEGKHGRIDILINNAGATFDGAVPDGTMSLREAFNASWDTNVSGTHVLTTLAVPLLLKSADPRLLFITSGTSSMTETDPSLWETVPTLARLNASPAKGWPKPHTLVSFPSYRSAKAGLNMLMREWARILKEDGVKVWAISPGFLATSLGGAGKEQLLKMGALEPHIGGEFVRDVVEGKRDHDAGKAIRSNMVQPW
ncbi:hypothetical protein DFH08DRAFT_738910 [Mycena albidolilacea]|uniref:NAD(P)-binding protein n=1 Tax=Mycena albidolilacea TaxID=1033008 RepID=A0AAD7EWG3_9AGAR|nr:hypothetical protein DFH08DRAFT_738910 [Mycena albidolilacea]